MSTNAEDEARNALCGRQRQVLEHAALTGWVAQPPSEDEQVMVEMWRSGLLRVNGGPGYQISRLGIETLSRRS